MTTTTASPSSHPSWNAPARSPSRQQPGSPSPSHSHSRSSIHKRVSSPNSARSKPAMSPMLSQSIPARTPANRHLDPNQQSSPNYFGLIVDTNNDGFSTADKRARNWHGSSSSNVHSAAACSPRMVPYDQNSDFAAFRKQSESTGSAFNLGHLADYDVLRSQSAEVPNSATTNAESPGRSPASSKVSKLSTPPSPNKGTASGASSGGSAHSHPKSPKRMLSEDSQNMLNHPRRESPASFTDSDSMMSSARSERTSRSSVPSTDRSNMMLSNSRSIRAETLPSSLNEEEGPVIVTPQHVVGLMKQRGEDILLLDLRVATYYARSRITGALNLCIPTTLLKRPTFNVQKLTDTFKDEEDRRKFERWSHSRYIVVYDQNSSQLKDATICVNTLKKFEREGWSGGSYIIRGGFDEFSKSFPSYIVRHGGAKSSDSSPSPDPSRPAGMAVIGGCPLPPTKNAANPFFGNIRQNMDLIGGVGQLPVKQPSHLNSTVESKIPTWLREAADEKDNGKRVADKFLHIEKREQKRMQEALSGNVIYGSPKPDAEQSVTLAGIEKGSKNRYNNIWPYEHSRVKLEHVSDGGCDYFNANFIQSPLSNRRYIATQGPIPATFGDFWNVIWQQDVRVIVMLTAESEGGQVKAHNYWSEGQYSHLNLQFLSEHRASLEPSKIHRHRDRRSNSSRRQTIAGHRGPSQDPLPRLAMASHSHSQSRPTNTPPAPEPEQPYVMVRRFLLSDSQNPFARPREVTQLQYSSWPDFGAPAHPTHLLGLVEQCDSVVRSSYGSDGTERPIVVHCSAGCGRTGTFCTVDTVVDVMRKQKARQEKAGRGWTTADEDYTEDRASMDVDMTSPGFTKTGGKVVKSPAPAGLADNPFDKSIVESSVGNNEAEILARDDLDLVEKTVEGFRLQRLSMVQSLRQFVLCYESVLEWLCEQQPRTA